MKHILIASLMALSLGGCMTSREGNVGAGAVIGGATGAVIGGLATDSVGGAVVGGVAGAVVGGALASSVEPDQREVRPARCYYSNRYGRRICRQN